MKKIAFIDVQNTDTTTQKMLGFVVDWKKLCEFLKNEKGYEKVYLYSGIEEGDLQTAAEFDAIRALGYAVPRTKVIKIYKKKDRIINVKCGTCKAENTQTIEMGYDKKANCDVELAVDALENAQDGSEREYMIFTGDGDFEFLMKNLIDKGITITVVSHAEVIQKAGLPYGRYSTKLRNLVKQNPQKLNFQEINNWKFKIKKDVS